MASLAPIALFAFNRPTHTRRTLAALAASPLARDSDLHIFIDHQRNDAEATAVAEVSRIAREATGFRSVTVQEALSNNGLYRAITQGVTRILGDAERVIVIEDDIVVSPFFLQYMNEALELYASEPRVGCIHGYAPPIQNLSQFFFLRGGDCWGWATWADRWTLFRPDPRSLIADLVSRRQLSKFCDSHGSQSLLQLVRRARGRNQSWAILWHASLFLAGCHTLHPGSSLVENIGNDGSGVHSASSQVHATHLASSYQGIPHLPVVEDARAAAALSAFLDAGPTDSWGRRTLLRLYAMISARLVLLLPQSDNRAN